MIDRIITKIKQQLNERKAIAGSLNYKNPHILLATWFGSGVILPASGTWGTLATIPFALPIWYFGGKAALFIFFLIICYVGIKAAQVFEKETGTHDCSLIVIDEVAGFSLALMAINFNPIAIAAAFVLFRAVDTIKPWPISWIDLKVGGAFGVMADDVAAGALTGLLLWGLTSGGYLP